MSTFLARFSLQSSNQLLILLYTFADATKMLNIPNIRLIQARIQRTLNHSPAFRHRLIPKPRQLLEMAIQTYQRALEMPFLNSLRIPAYRHFALSASNAVNVVR
jgi:hypothetical protein